MHFLPFSYNLLLNTHRKYIIIDINCNLLHPFRVFVGFEVVFFSVFFWSLDLLVKGSGYVAGFYVIFSPEPGNLKRRSQ